MHRCYSVYEADRTHYDSVIKPKLSGKHKPSIYWTFTYITPNYLILYSLRELAKLQREGFTIIIGVWDINTINHPYTRQFTHVNESKEEFIESKIAELRTLAQAAGLAADNLIVYRTSDLWRSFVTCSNPPLLNQFYGILMNMDVEDLEIKQKVSHLIQMPMDVCIAAHLHLLCGEQITRPVETMYVGKNRQQLYVKTREIMFEYGIITDRRPVFIFSDDMPILIHNNLIPEWNMTEDEIKHIVGELNPTRKEMKLILSGILDDNPGLLNNVQVPAQQILSSLGDNQEANNQLLATNLYIFLQQYRMRLRPQQATQAVLRVRNREDAMNIGKILKSELHISILELSDGTLTTTQIAKKLRKQVANISNYIHQLKDAGLVETDMHGKITRKVRTIAVNLDADLH